MRRLLALPLAALAIALACAAAATAGTSPRITQARAPFPQRAFVLSLPTAMRLSAREVAGRSRTARDPLRRSFSPG